MNSFGAVLGPVRQQVAAHQCRGGRDRAECSAGSPPRRTASSGGRSGSRCRPCCRTRSRGSRCRSGAGCSTRSSAPHAPGPPLPPPEPASLQGSPTLWCAGAYFQMLTLFGCATSLASMHLPSPSPLPFREYQRRLDTVREHQQASAALGQ